MYQQCSKTLGKSMASIGLGFQQIGEQKKTRFYNLLFVGMPPAGKANPKLTFCRSR